MRLVYQAKHTGVGRVAASDIKARLASVPKLQQHVYLVKRFTFMYVRSAKWKNSAKKAGVFYNKKANVNLYSRRLKKNTSLCVSLFTHSILAQSECRCGNGNLADRFSLLPSM